MEPIFRIFVPGEPAPKGSWKMYRGRLVPDCKRSAPWQKTVADAVSLKWHKEPLACCVELYLQFRLTRPKCHYRRGRFSHLLRPSAPQRKHGETPDADKLDRCILDALTGVLYKDDKLVWRRVSEKIWVDVGSDPGVVIHAYADDWETPT